MRADELNTAVTRVVELLNQAGIRAAIDRYRLSKGEERSVAAARLGVVGASLVDEIGELSATELKVVKCLHLESMGSPDYWAHLLGENDDPKAHQGEIVRLASRVMFASSQLPALTSMLANVDIPAITPQAVVAPPANPMLHPVGKEEGALFLRLTDAGERACDPDRIARAIDGVDMLYSACASLARKPAIDLRLDNIIAKRNGDRDFRFTGDTDSISAVFAVIDSIPGALADIDAGQEIDLDAVVRSLPVFKDLTTLASLGTFSGNDLKDISETMHQGSLLTLESGVILIDENIVTQGADLKQVVTEPLRSVGTSSDATQPSAAESDEYYNRYLKEREAMMRSQATSDLDIINGHAKPDLSVSLGRAQSGTEDKSREDAVDELLKSLQQSRPS